MSVEIRSASLTDYEALCKLMSQVDTLHRVAHPDRFRAAQPAREITFIQSWLDDADKHIWVAENNSNVVGVAMFAVRHSRAMPIITPRTTIELDTLVVDEHHQRAGVGQALMEAIHQWGQKHQIDDIKLSVYAFNEAALAFYRHLGYEVLVHRMVRKLDEPWGSS